MLRQNFLLWPSTFSVLGKPMKNNLSPLQGRKQGCMLYLPNKKKIGLSSPFSNGNSSEQTHRFCKKTASCNYLATK